MRSGFFLREKAKEIRKDILQICYEAQGAAHPGGALSMADVAAALYYDSLQISDDPEWDERDRVVLSKGHSAPLLYAVLAQRGYFPKEWFKGLRGVGGKLQGHPDMKKTPGVDFTSGSLGNGLAAAAGMALGLKMDGKPSFVYTVIGDGETQEGLMWEAALCAASLKLDNLIAIVDINGLQSCGAVRDISPVEPLDEKFESFRWKVKRINGHDMAEIVPALEWAREKEGCPKAVLAETVKGKGVSFMEGNNSWHQKKLTDAEYAAAISEIEYGHVL